MNIQESPYWWHPTNIIFTGINVRWHLDVLWVVTLWCTHNTNTCGRLHTCTWTTFFYKKTFTAITNHQCWRLKTSAGCWQLAAWTCLFMDTLYLSPVSVGSVQWPTKCTLKGLWHGRRSAENKEGTTLFPWWVSVCVEQLLHSAPSTRRKFGNDSKWLLKICLLWSEDNGSGPNTDPVLSLIRKPSMP